MHQNQTASPGKESFWFFVLAFLFSWMLWTPRLLEAAGLIKLPVIAGILLGNLALFGPALAAFILTGSKQGKSAVGDLWRRGWRLNASKVWLLPAVLIMPCIAGVTLLVMQLMKIPVEWQYAQPLAMIALIFILIYLGAIGEEYGWRGYALDRLQSIWTPLKASLLLGLIWGLWHLPLHFTPGSTQSAIPIWQYILQTIALSVLYTWLYNRTNRSVLITTIFHAIGNLSAAYIPTWTNNTGRWINFILILAVILGMAYVVGMKKYRKT